MQIGLIFGPQLLVTLGWILLVVPYAISIEVYGVFAVDLYLSSNSLSMPHEFNALNPEDGNFSTNNTISFWGWHLRDGRPLRAERTGFFFLTKKWLSPVSKAINTNGVELRSSTWYLKDHTRPWWCWRMLKPWKRTPFVSSPKLPLSEGGMSSPGTVGSSGSS